MVFGGDCVCTLWFLRPDLLGVCCQSSVLSRAFVLRSPLELIIIPLPGWQHIPSPSLAGSQTWVSSTTRGRRLTFGGQSLLPHSMGREQGWGHLRANPGFGYSGSSLLSCPSLSLDNLLYRENFPGLHTG